ncbi:hypothetical protein Lal_00011285 [Lupinus albus]|nr:hypothetical protein Lal_00011285 [Lupinus albus]
MLKDSRPIEICLAWARKRGVDTGGLLLERERDYAAKFEELARFGPYYELEVDGRSKCSKFESGLKPKLKMTFGHQEISNFPTLVNKCRMYEDDMKADEVATAKSIPPKNFGPQGNLMHGKGKGKVFQEERKPYSPPTANVAEFMSVICAQERHLAAFTTRRLGISRGILLSYGRDPRLSERFSLGRERLTWEGETLGYTRGFSLEQELSRLGEKWHFETVETVRFSLVRESLA